jgi:apolipoprotein N-acyltransferase
VDVSEGNKMKKFINLKALAIGGTFMLAMAGLGSWWFKIPFWQAVLIGLACMAILGVVAAFENGSEKRSEK